MVPLSLRIGVERTLLEGNRSKYDKYRVQTLDFGETSGRGDEGGLDFDALLEKHLLLAEVGDGGDVTEEALVDTRTYTIAAGYDVPVSKKGYAELLSSFATEMQEARRDS